jgi:hypothetical protein
MPHRCKSSKWVEGDVVDGIGFDELLPVGDGLAVTLERKSFGRSLKNEKKTTKQKQKETMGLKESPE